MTVIVVTGIQAAGKSTIAQALAERLERSVHLRGDVFRRMIVSGRADPPAQAVWHAPPERLICALARWPTRDHADERKTRRLASALFGKSPQDRHRRLILGLH